MARVARSPVIAMMGHIDHGKSSLLDYIRRTNVVADRPPHVRYEAGGITQHVAAYIAHHNGKPITFLDTPGHEAFKTLRTRGAAAADIAILVVAADEGVMPQTLDALSAIKDAEIPYVIAITKIDKNNADIDRTKNSLIENEIFVEGMGGDIAFAPVSSKTGDGISELLDLIILLADLAELTADHEAMASGFVLESTQEPKRGASATLVVKDGTLNLDGFVVAGDAYAPIRFIEDFQGKRVTKAEPSEPVRVSGFNKLPTAGSLFKVFATKKEAENAASKFFNSLVTSADRNETVEGISELPVIIKADVAGSIDAISHELNKITHERARIRIVSSSVGNVAENDVRTAQASGATIVAFNVGTDPIARDLAEREKIFIFQYSIIYELSAKIRELLMSSVPAEKIEKELGRAMILKTFSSGTKKKVFGARHISGIISVDNRIKLIRKGAEIARGSIKNLQQARADVKEIKTEGDFGAEVELGENAEYGDELIAFAITET